LSRQSARQGLPHREDQRGHVVRQLRHPHHHLRFTAEARKANQALVDLIGTIAARKNATPAQIALAWLLAQQSWIVPIPGTRRLERLDENIGAVDPELTPDDLREIETAASQIPVQGARYPEHLERLTNR
jgi:aryl-alcohol dehydrogenase-like predicted oxidoreductase